MWCVFFFFTLSFFWILLQLYFLWPLEFWINMYLFLSNQLFSLYWCSRYYWKLEAFHDYFCIANKAIIFSRSVLTL